MAIEGWPRGPALSWRGRPPGPRGRGRQEVPVRATISVTAPLGVSSGQLRAMASLLAGIEQARWESLSRTFDRLDADNAVLPEALEQLLGALAGQMRVLARERATDEEEAARLAEAA